MDKAMHSDTYEECRETIFQMHNDGLIEGPVTFAKLEFFAAEEYCKRQNQSLRSELQKQKELNAELFKYEVSPRVAGLIIQVRDAIATKDYDEAYHILYQIASPGFNKTDPWGELESLIKKYKES